MSAALLALLFCPTAAGISLVSEISTNQQLLYGLSFNRTRFPPAWQNCNEPHPGDLFRPIRQVLREHPHVDGNCWFHFAADYLGDPEDYAENFLQTVEHYSVNAGKGQQATLHLTTGEDLVTHLDGNWGLYPYDDAMCYMMGWLKGQRLDAHVMDLRDREAWLRVSEAECARLPQMLPDGLNENSSKLTIGYMAADNVRICRASSCLTQPRGASCAKPTLEDYVFHLYPKCLLGGERLTGAAGQIAWCFARACVTDGNVIRHGRECWPAGTRHRQPA